MVGSNWGQKMKITTTLLLMLCAMLFTLKVWAQVERSQLTSNVAHSEPVDNLQNTVVGQRDEIKKVYFFTHIVGLNGQQVVHRWLYQGQEKAAVSLTIGSDSWRTYSSKNIPDYWQGQWQVQVWQNDLMVLSHDFELSYPR
jgi:uncharacterized membrane protein